MVCTYLSGAVISSSTAASALGQGHSAGDIMVQSLPAWDCRGVTEILSPERFSHLNRLPLLFVPFTLWEDGKPAPEKHLLMPHLQVVSFLHLHIWVSHKHSPSLGAGARHAQLCHAASCATEAAACPAMSDLTARWWWQALSQGKEGCPFLQHLKDLHFYSTYTNLGGLGMYLLWKGTWCFTGVSQGPAGNNLSLYLIAVGVAGATVSCWNWREFGLLFLFP